MSRQPLQHTGKFVAGLIGLFFSLAQVALADPWSETGATIYPTDTSKKVGVGTSSPSTLFTIASSSSSGTQFEFDNDDTGSKHWLFLASGSGNSEGAGSLSILDSSVGARRLTIDPSGKVGIGTYDPNRTLEIVGDAKVSDELILGDTAYFEGLLPLQSSTSRGIIYSENGSSVENLALVIQGSSNDSGHPISFATGSTPAERMRITSGGNVGIGTTGPGTKLDVNGNITISNALQSAGALVFNTNGANERLRITSSGDVGIGTNNPQSRLEVVGKTTMSQSSNAWALYATSTTEGDDEGAIYGEAVDPDTAHNTVGIWGVTNASGNANGQPIGVRGDAKDNSPAEGQYGVLGNNWATNQTSGLQGAGVYGGSSGDPSNVADYTGRGHGVQGETYASNDNSAGGIFYSNHSTGTSPNGEAEAVRGIVTSTDLDAYAFKGDGSMIVSGSKSALVNTEMQGPTEMYSIESSEIWFEDIGEGQLVNGEAVVEIDPLFLQTITVDSEHPIQVFIQPYGASAMYVERDVDAFTVRSIDDPTSTSSFGYRLTGKRKHYEDRRMRQTTGPIDQFMEPGLTSDELLLLNERWGMGETFRDTYYHQFADQRVMDTVSQ